MKHFAASRQRNRKTQPLVMRVKLTRIFFRRVKTSSAGEKPPPCSYPSGIEEFGTRQF